MNVRKKRRSAREGERRTGAVGRWVRPICLGFGLLGVACLAPGQEASLADAPFQAAYDEADITPPLGGSMPGYFKDRQATGVLDPLKAKVLYLRKGGDSVALVACDLIGMDAGTVARIREAVARTARPAPRHVWVHCTHTHTGAMVPRGGGFTSDAATIYPDLFPGRVDEEWVRQLVDRTAQAVARAARAAADERKLTLHEGEERTVAHYRRFVMKDGTVRTNPGRNNPEVVRPAGEIDPRLHVLKFESRRIVTVLYGLHPDTVGGAQYSADYPHFLTETLRQSLGSDWRVVFLNTCCGNINHINVRNPAQKGGPDEARRIGATLAGATLAALKEGKELRVDRLAAESTRVASKLRRPRPEEAAEAEERLRTGADPFSFNGLFAPAVRVLAQTRDREHPAEIAALRLGDFGLAALPGEIFVELGREVEAGSPFQPTRTLGLTNGSMGYIPTRQGYVEGGYEAGYRSARYEPENGHRWAAAAVRLLHRLDE